MGKPLVIAQTDGAILARFTAPAGKDQMPDFKELLQQHPGVLRTLRRNKPVRLQSDDLPYAARIWPISIKKEPVGILCIFEDSLAPMTELEARTAEYATLILALHISWQRQLASLESQLGYSFLESLKEGISQPTLQMAERAEILGFDPKTAYRTGLIVMDLSLPLSREGLLKREKLAARLRSALLDLGAKPLISVAQNQITFLLPESLNAGQVWKYLQDEPRLLLAVSRPHAGFSGVQKGYQETVSMIPHLVPGRYTEYEDLLVPRLLLGEEEARQSFMDKMFQKFAQTRNGDVLAETLIAAARHNFQLKKTAEHLNIHPKTLRYRLDRAASIAGFDLEDPETQFQLQLAARISALKDPGR
jgi:purine catabolism regulator